MTQKTVVEKAADAMLALAAQAQVQEAADRAENAAPVDAALPLVPEPFDAERAFEQISAKSEFVTAMKASADSAKRKAKAAHDEYLEAVADLDKLIKTLAESKRAQDVPALPFDEHVTDTV